MLSMAFPKREQIGFREIIFMVCVSLGKKVLGGTWQQLLPCSDSTRDPCRSPNLLEPSEIGKEIKAQEVRACNLITAPGLGGLELCSVSNSAQSTN